MILRFTTGVVYDIFQVFLHAFFGFGGFLGFLTVFTVTLRLVSRCGWRSPGGLAADEQPTPTHRTLAGCHSEGVSGGSRKWWMCFCCCFCNPWMVFCLEEFVVFWFFLGEIKRLPSAFWKPRKVKKRAKTFLCNPWMFLLFGRRENKMCFVCKVCLGWFWFVFCLSLILFRCVFDGVFLWFPWFCWA